MAKKDKSDKKLKKEKKLKASKKEKKSNEGVEDKMRKLEEDISTSRKKLVKLLRKQAAMDVQDYTMKDTAGNDIKLSEMFGDKENLILIHNMGKSCPYCTLWADGFSGVAYFIEKKAAFALTSPDSPDVQKQFAESRGWKMKTYSAAGTSFIKDMGYEMENKSYWPGVSVFHKDSNGQVTRVAMDFFGPGDFYASPFHLFDLIPGNVNED